MNENVLVSEFEKRIHRFSGEYETLDSKHKSLSILRVTIFVVLASLIVYAASDRNGVLMAVLTIIAIVAFAIIIRIHNRVKFDRKTASFLKGLNEEEAKRAEGDLSKVYQGNEYENQKHFYSTDLDIFGSNSLFQLVLRSRLKQTRDLGAKWLLNHADKQEITERQQAIEELRKDIEWRQEFTALGMHTEMIDPKKRTNPDDLIEWLSKENKSLNKPYWKILTPLMSLVSITVIGLIWFTDIPYQIIYIPILVNLLLLKVAFKPLMTFTKTFDRAVDFLKSYEKLIIKAENRSFQSPKLIALQEIFKSEDYQASMAIGSLRKILYRLMNRMNLMYAAVNVFFLLDMALLLNAEKWKAKYGSKVKLWFDTIHEIDLLNDMSSMAYGNPDFIFPEIRDGKHQLNTIDLGHPLIHASGRIKNNFELNGEGSLGLITGSNMSGKSTFLRTVGVNLVMAQAGLPVCASTLTMSPTRVFTSMRTQDNLEEHISSFYAELSRIKLLLDSIGEAPIFFLLDEILKGTNSEDRHKGSLALIDQLSEKNGTGLISTHDLTLSNLKNEKARNYSFNSEIIKDEIIFDYKLTDGPCRSFNASKLMEQMGIIVSK
jgi:hypothetical protein